MDIKITIITYSGTVRTRTVSSPLVEAVYKIIKATYLDEEVVSVRCPVTDPEALGEFLTFILAYPKGVKTPIVKVEYSISQPRESQNDDLSNYDVVCFSGGIDSTGAILHLLERGKSIIALWCDYGQHYNKSEQQAVRRICSSLSVPLYEASIDLSELIKLGEARFNHVFPARNLLIASIAAALNPRDIILAGLSDELIVPDKSLRMYAEAPKYLSHKLYSPFVKMTKAEVLSVWKKRWNSVLSAEDTVSCYDAGGNCQNCSSCAKREVALISSGYSKKFPIVFDNQSELIESHWFSRIEQFQSSRRDEILIALNVFRDDIGENLRALQNIYFEKYSNEVHEWYQHLMRIEDVVS
jgi:7-cyano-7-deazaguanine synthase in queuosine biosynthesis